MSLSSSAISWDKICLKKPTERRQYTRNGASLWGDKEKTTTHNKTLNNFWRLLMLIPRGWDEYKKILFGKLKLGSKEKVPVNRRLSHRFRLPRLGRWDAFILKARQICQGMTNATRVVMAVDKAFQRGRILFSERMADNENTVKFAVFWSCRLCKGGC